MMTNNWEEAADFINFCNQLEVPVMFHTVRQPAKLSLKHLSSPQLTEICSHLDPAFMNLPDNNEVQKKNKKHLADFLNQLNEWSKIENEAQAISSTEEMVQYIRKKIFDRSDLPDNVKEKKFSAFVAKLIQLQEILPADFKAGSYIAGFIEKEDVELRSFLSSFESLSPPQIKRYLETFYQLNFLQQH
jgi:hypothetical protein